ncbi:MAG: glycoside hydrolase family 3 N-terminal domain-containing protein [Brevefilum sp.]
MSGLVKMLWRVLLLFGILIGPLANQPGYVAAQSSSEALLQEMSAEEKIGQLFLVSFRGSEITEDSRIVDLIADRHIGGVVLLAENNNFTSSETVLNAREMILDLQQLEWNVSADVSRAAGDDGSAAYVPLLIGLKQIGNGYPGDQILTGLTQLPSQMSIGATWDTNMAEQVGEVLGQELSSLGVNLLLGPNLDVIETTNIEAASSLGVNTYGGDPFWVGEMGKSFISGVHVGSGNRMIVISQNFPGTGNSDRSPEMEVATVRKSLEQLKQIELAPYFTVTEPPVGDPGRVDGVMVSHIRYQGFQGNIRATTRPISFDSSAFSQIMSLPQFASWREEGGLVISDNLGSNSVRRFFDPNETNFDALQVARSAFLAGNDMLYVDDLISSGDPDAYTTLTSILNFFVQKYQEDSAFAKRVDSSVLRILNAKRRLYGDFSLATVLQSGPETAALGDAQESIFDVAQAAATLIDPSPDEIDTVFPSPPLWYEDIVIFSDVRSDFQCNNCPPINSLSTRDLERSLVDLYGSQIGGQILEGNISSYTFAQLVGFLDNIENDSTEFMPANLRAADWVIFNTLDIDPQHPESNALQRVLTERPDLLAGKSVIVFALDSPTYLDATNISKVTAYYALYSKAPAFLDVAARVLMKELTPTGALPVSLNAVGYDLITITSPDPAQVIPLNLVLPEEAPEATPEATPEETPAMTQTPEPIAMPSYNIGDTITVRTGVIRDHNGNMVPDDTPVRFNFRISGEPGVTQQFETTTTGGVAYFTYRVEAAGGLEISATSEPASQSEILQINISTDGSTSVTAFTPTPMISPTATITPSITPSQQPSPTSTPTPDAKSYPTIGDWALALLVMGGGGGIAFLIGFVWWGSPRWGLRSSLCAFIGALLAYSYLNIGLEGTRFWMAQSGTIFVVEMVFVGLLIGWIVCLIWWMRTAGRYPKRFKK